MRKIIAVLLLTLTVGGMLFSSNTYVSAKEIHVNSEKKLRKCLKNMLRVSK